MLARKDNLERKYTKQFLFLLFIFSFVFVFASSDTNKATESTLLFHNLFLKGIGYYNFFSFFDLLLIVISILLIKKFKLSYSRASWKEKFIFILTLVYFIFLMINPNNNTLNPILGMPLFSDTSHYSHILFLIAIFFIKTNKAFIIFLRKIMPMIFALVTFRSLILFVLWSLGKGNPNLFRGIKSILTEDDTIFIFAFVQLIFLLIYFLSYKERYLLLSGFLFLFQILTFRRSGFFVSLLSSSILSLVYFFKSRNTIKKVLILKTSVILLCCLFLAITLLPDNIKTYFYRNFGAFLSVDIGGIRDYEVEKNVHFEQALWGTKVALKKMGFWGAGYGNEYSTEYWWPGSTGLHNAYIQSWLQYGFFAFLYYVFIISIFLLEVIKTVKNYRKYDYQFLLIRSCVIIFFLIFLINIFVLTIHQLTEIRMIIFRVLILSFLFKITPNNYKLLFKKNY